MIIVVVCSFNDDWVINVFSNGFVVFYVVSQWVVRIGYIWYVCFFYGVDSRNFVIYKVDSFSFRVNENKVVFFYCFSKVCVFCQEIVIWVNSNRVSDFCSSNNVRNVQVVFGC